MKGMLIAGTGLPKLLVITSRNSSAPLGICFENQHEIGTSMTVRQDIKLYLMLVQVC